MSSSTPRIKVLLRSEETEGVVSAIQITAAAGFPGPPLHHHDFDETFHILEGEMTFQVRDELVTTGAGELLFAPRGVPHTLANLSGETARYLVVCTPAGFERHFGRMAAEQAGKAPPEWTLQEVPEVVRVGPRIGEEAG